VPKKSKLIIDLFIENERRISQLYKLYSRHFPASRNFWENIHEEEIGHVEILKNVKAIMKKGGKSIGENNFSRDILKYIGNFIREALKRAGDKKLTAMEALETALRLEQSMVENKSFEMFSPAHLPVRIIFQKLNRDTERHARLIRKELRKNIQT
jgi:hypothetical protein